ncbi:uncharacterized protein LOC114250825 [Bombyx mandarina]|uniref:Uncharacterized protein LOC114250825 n=1 Tax=Bombyx mandarina TaxID=7092 RepID=A0A6J2KEB2_BOMMA|nr:uncharacterized protein LOC114250825 [Bombyx mandarina]
MVTLYVCVGRRRGVGRARSLLCSTRLSIALSSTKHACTRPLKNNYKINMAKSVAFAFAVLLALFETGYCIKCYQCNSEQDKNCGDPFKSAKPPVECNTQDSINFNTLYLRNILPVEVLNSVTGAPRYCHKIVMKSGTVVRTCLDVNPNDSQHTCRVVELASNTAIADSAKVKSCAVCNKDNCNGAGSISFSLPLATFALIATYFVFKQ